MKRGQGKLQRKGITSLSIITTPVIILAGILCLLISQQAGPLIYGKIASGSSFFIPSIPAINLFYLFPETVSMMPFTLGNLVDLIIDVYIVLSIGIIPYRWQKIAREPWVTFVDLRSQGLFDITNPRSVSYPASGSEASQRLARVMEKEAMPPGVALAGTPKLGYHEKAMGSRNRALHTAQLPKDQPAHRNIKANNGVVVAFLFFCISTGSFYPCLRASEPGARDVHPLFFKQKSNYRCCIIKQQNERKEKK
ncbi:MAG: hypothetical protein Q6373_021375 [Candidatus Sigynarchaeota archaeon]